MLAEEKEKEKVRAAAVTCILCYNEALVIGIGPCNHQPICYKCIFKMRKFSNQKHCPICSVRQALDF